MKRKRYKSGELLGEFLLLEKEVYPSTTNSGKRKVRRAFFECTEHEGKFFKLSFQAATSKKRQECLCNVKFNGELVHKTYSKEDVESYSYQKARQWHSQALKKTPAGWFWVSRIGIFLKRADDSNMLFYKFTKTDRTGQDYKTARRIEDITWNRPKVNKSFYLMRLSYEYDRLHREGLMDFKSDLWNRGAGVEVFDNILKQ